MPMNLFGTVSCWQGRAARAICLLPLSLATSAAHAQLFDFTIDSAASGVEGSMLLAVPTSGTVIGNWDAQGNPDGTRTKPGLFGSFGPAENVPVPITADLNIGGPINSSASGLFRLGIDAAAGTAQMTGYTSNLLHGASINLPITLNLLFDSFRTRAPDSVYIGGVPLPVPLGETSLTHLSLRQIGGGGGLITPAGPNQYNFTITPIVEMTIGFSAMGSPFLIPGAPAPWPLEGSITVNGESASVKWTRMLEVSQQQPVNEPLPQFPFGLPTVLPPGEVAQLLMDLTVGTISSDLQGGSTVNASGLLVPAPGGLLVLGFAGLIVARRRR